MSSGAAELNTLSNRLLRRSILVDQFEYLITLSITFMRKLTLDIVWLILAVLTSPDVKKTPSILTFSIGDITY